MRDTGTGMVNMHTLISSVECALVLQKEEGGVRPLYRDDA